MTIVVRVEALGRIIAVVLDWTLRPVANLPVLRIIKS